MDLLIKGFWVLWDSAYRSTSAPGDRDSALLQRLNHRERHSQVRTCNLHATCAAKELAEIAAAQFFFQEERLDPPARSHLRNRFEISGPSRRRRGTLRSCSLLFGRRDPYSCRRRHRRRSRRSFCCRHARSRLVGNLYHSMIKSDSWVSYLSISKIWTGEERGPHDVGPHCYPFLPGHPRCVAEYKDTNDVQCKKILDRAKVFSQGISEDVRAEEKQQNEQEFSSAWNAFRFNDMTVFTNAFKGGDGKGFAKGQKGGGKGWKGFSGGAAARLRRSTRTK